MIAIRFDFLQDGRLWRRMPRGFAELRLFFFNSFFVPSSRRHFSIVRSIGLVRLIGLPGKKSDDFCFSFFFRFDFSILPICFFSYPLLHTLGRRVLHLFFNFFPFFFHPHRRRRSYTHTTKKETRRRGKKRKKRNETKLRSSCPEERPEGVVVEREKKEIAKKKKKNRFLLLWFSPIFVRFPRFPTPRNTKKKRPGERCGLAAFYWVFVPSFRTAVMGWGGGTLRANFCFFFF